MSFAWKSTPPKRVNFNFDNLEGTMFARFNRWRKSTRETEKQEKADVSISADEKPIDVTTGNVEQDNEPQLMGDKTCDNNNNRNNDSAEEETEKHDEGTEKGEKVETAASNTRVTDEKEVKENGGVEDIDFSLKEVISSNDIRITTSGNVERTITNDKLSTIDAPAISSSSVTDNKDRDSGIDSDSRGSSPPEDVFSDSRGSSLQEEDISENRSSSPREGKCSPEEVTPVKVVAKHTQGETCDTIKKRHKYRKSHRERRTKSKESSRSNSEVSSGASPEKLPLVTVETKQTDHSDCSCERLSLPHKGDRCPFLCILEIRQNRKGQPEYYISSSPSSTRRGILKKPGKYISFSQHRKRKGNTDLRSLEFGFALPSINHNRLTDCACVSEDKCGSERRKHLEDLVAIDMKSTRSDTDGDTSSDHYGSSGDNQRRMPFRKIFRNKNALSKKVADLDKMLSTMRKQREDLEIVLQTIRRWSAELRSVDRTSLGVPYIRAVKNVLVKQRQSMTKKRGEYHRRVTCLREAGVPGFERAYSLIHQMKSDVTSIVRDERKYSAKHVEDLRLLQGKLIGTCSAILAVYYEE